MRTTGFPPAIPSPADARARAECYIPRGRPRGLLAQGVPRGLSRSPMPDKESRPMPAIDSPASSFAGRTSTMPFDVRPAPRPTVAQSSIQTPRPTAAAAPRTGSAPGPQSEAEPARTSPPAAGILVTGSHRSGTTWVGKMLAEARGLCYLHEPFKPRWDPPYVWTHFDTWFLHVADFNAAEHERAVARTLGLRFSWRRHFAQDPSL